MDSKYSKKKALIRFPPGDRWISAEYENGYSRKNPPDVFDTLTDGLEWLYKQNECKKFIVDAEQQAVYMITDEQEVIKPTDNKYSIYGE